MAQRKPVAVLANGLGELPATDTIPLPAFGAAGIVSGCKLWIGETTTNASGAWTIDFSAAGFTSPPKVFPSALSLGTGVNASATAILTARTATTAAGYVNNPATIVIGGLGDTRAGAGITVMVLAIGP